MPESYPGISNQNNVPINLNYRYDKAIASLDWGQIFTKSICLNSYGVLKTQHIL